MEFKHFLQSNRKYAIGLGVAVLVVLMALLSVVVYNRQTSKPTPTAVFTVVAKVTPEPGDRPRECQVVQPPGWIRYTVQEGDNLTILAESRSVSVARIKQVNCLTSDLIIAGHPLYLPPIPTPTPCPVTPPFDWAPYSVQIGDTLSDLAASRGTTVAEIARVNCLTIEDILPTGKTIYVPQLPTPTPTATPTATPIPTLPPATPTPVVVTLGATAPAQTPSQPGTLTLIPTLPLGTSTPAVVTPGATAPARTPSQPGEDGTPVRTPGSQSATTEPTKHIVTTELTPDRGHDDDEIVTVQVERTREPVETPGPDPPIPIAVGVIGPIAGLLIGGATVLAARWMIRRMRRK